MLTIGLDADHTLSVERAPCSIALLGLTEIPAADDGSLRSRQAGSFDFLPVAGVKLDAAGGAIQFVKHHGDDAAASVVDELFNESGFVHGKKQRKGVSARERTIPWLVREKGLSALLSHFVTKLREFFQELQAPGLALLG